MSSMMSGTTGSPGVPGPAADCTTTIAAPSGDTDSQNSNNGRQPDEIQQIVRVDPWANSSWALLRQCRFGLFFFGSLTSNLGTWLQSTAQILIAYQITRSVFIVGAITSAQFAGMIAVSPWSAVVADRIGTRNLLILTQGSSAIIAIYMAWSYHSKMLGVHTLIFCALGLGLAYALALPVQTALVPMLVEPADATNAVRMNSVSYNAGRALAPVLSVLVIASLGPDLIFILNAISFIVFAFCLASVLPLPNQTSGQMQDRHDQKDPDDPGRPHVADGVKTALRHRRILLLLAIVAAVTFADDPIFVQSPALAQAKLSISAHWAGYFIAALGWGSVLGSIPLTSKKDNAKRASKRAAFGLVALSVSVFIFAIGFSPLISLLAAFAAGVAGLYTGTAAQTALLRHQKNLTVVSVASVAALWAIAWAGTKPFASLLDGVLATHLGLTHSAGILVLPALAIACGEIFIPSSQKKRINDLAGRVISFLHSPSPSAQHQLPASGHEPLLVTPGTDLAAVGNDEFREECGQFDAMGWQPT